MRRIDEVFVGNALGHSGVAAAVAEAIGADQLPVTRVEQACASSSTALRLAAEAVASGRRQNVLAIGVEKMSPGLLDLGNDASYASLMGLDVLPLLYGLKACQYLRCHGVHRDELARIAAQAHSRGALAPYARFGFPCSVADVLGSPMIADPLTRLELAGSADGAAAAVVTSSHVPVQLRAWEGAIGLEDPLTGPEGGWDHRERLTEFLAAGVYDQGGIGPSDVQVVQLNDASAIASALYLEALGLAERGSGIAVAVAGHADNGAVVNTDGGLLGRGHSLGATGLAMLYELWLQLRGEAGPRQLDRAPSAALLHSHGLGGDNIFTLTR